MAESLGEEELSRIEEHLCSHKMTLALVRTEHAPAELGPLLESAASRLGLGLARMYSSPMSEFSMAEFGPADRALVMIFTRGTSTELVSVSETDEVAVKDLEDSIHYSNFHSEIMRLGL